MPLKLSLKPGERFVLNGAVVENGDRRATLVLQNKASVLREKDIMQEDEVDTPAKRIYFPVMMMYLSSSTSDGVYDQFVLRMTEFMGAISNQDVLNDCVTISRDVMAGEYYKALLRARKLIAYEADRLGGAPPAKPSSQD